MRRYDRITRDMMAQAGYVVEGIGGDLIAYVRHHANGDADIVTLRDGEDRLPRRGTDAVMVCTAFADGGESVGYWAQDFPFADVYDCLTDRPNDTLDAIFFQPDEEG